MSFAAVPGTALHPHLGAGHKGGVKADSELADQVNILFCGLDQLVQKSIGSGMGDGPQILFQLRPGHADAGIGNNQGMCFFIQINGDFQRHMGIEDVLGSEALVPELLQRIGSIGDQFPNKDIPLRIERMDNYIKQFFGFSLEFVGRCFHCAPHALYRSGERILIADPFH